jgi:hypothetical protein
LRLNDWLLGVFLSALALWIGGAIVTDACLSSLRRSIGDREIGPLIAVAGRMHALVYMPLAVLACGTGMWFTWRMGLTITEWWIRAPVIAYVAILLVSALYLLPEYRQLRAMSADDDADAAALQRRFTTAIWIGRAQLLVAVLALWNVVLRLEL